MPTLGEFLARAQGKGIRVGVSEPATGPAGALGFRYMQRTPTSPPIIIDDDDTIRLTPVVLSNYCRQMGLDPKSFGMNLGGLGEAP
jgi:hypothetical protein